MKLNTIEAITQALDDAQVRYLIVGGLAVAMHGYSRSTYDLDLVVQLQDENIRTALSVLEGFGYHPSAPIAAEDFADPSQRRKWVDEKGMQVINLVSDRYPETAIDIFAFEPFDFDVEYGRAYRQQLRPGLTLQVVNLDTLIEMKRNTGRALDQMDAEELAKIRGALDE